MQFWVLTATVCIAFFYMLFELEKIKKRTLLMAVAGVYAFGSLWHVTKWGFSSYAHNVLFPAIAIAGLVLVSGTLYEMRYSGEEEERK